MNSTLVCSGAKDSSIEKVDISSLISLKFKNSIKATVKKRDLNRQNPSQKLLNTLGIGGPGVNFLASMSRDHSDQTPRHQFPNGLPRKGSTNLLHQNT